MVSTRHIDQASATVFVVTTLPPQQVLDIAASIAGTKPNNLFRGGPDKIVLVRRGEQTVFFAVQTITGKKGLIFKVFTNTTDTGSKALCKIEDFKIVKDGMFSARRVWGYYLYDFFMDSFAERIRAADPSARIDLEKQLPRGD